MREAMTYACETLLRSPGATLCRRGFTGSRWEGRRSLWSSCIDDVYQELNRTGMSLRLDGSKKRFFK